MATAERLKARASDSRIRAAPTKFAASDSARLGSRRPSAAPA